MHPNKDRIQRQLQVNEKSFRLKEEYRDGVRREQDPDAGEDGSLLKGNPRAR